MHVCRDDGPGAVTTARVGALEVWQCATCGAKGSDQACQIGKPHADATGECRSCGRFTCDAHRSKRGRICATCERKLALIKQPSGRGPRFGRAVKES